MTDSPAEHPKIAKWLAAHGVASRRAAERLVAEGAVTVNGEIMTNTAERIRAGIDLITVHGKSLDAVKPPARIWRFYKPKGCLTSLSDPEGRETIYDVLPSALSHLKYIGRLDYNTEGLLLMTNDGGLSKQMTDPQAGIPRVYRARCRGYLDKKLLNDIRQGITVDGFHYKPAGVKVTANDRAAPWVDLTLYEGKYREVRVLLDYAGLQVSRLIRTSYGDYTLAGLEPGDVVEDKVLIQGS